MQQSRTNWSKFVATQNARVLEAGKFFVFNAAGEYHMNFISKFPALAVAQKIGGTVVDRDGQPVS